jgi:hypothetical protein
MRKPHTASRCEALSFEPGRRDVNSTAPITANMFADYDDLAGCGKHAKRVC